MAISRYSSGPVTMHLRISITNHYSHIHTIQISLANNTQRVNDRGKTRAWSRSSPLIDARMFAIDKCIHSTLIYRAEDIFSRGKIRRNDAIRENSEKWRDDENSEKWRDDENSENRATRFSKARGRTGGRDRYSKIGNEREYRVSINSSRRWKASPFDILWMLDDDTRVAKYARNAITNIYRWTWRRFATRRKTIRQLIAPQLIAVIVQID